MHLKAQKYLELDYSLYSIDILLSSNDNPQKSAAFSPLKLFRGDGPSQQGS